MTKDNHGHKARIEYLRVENYRALKHVEFKSITPMTALLGPNGSGKSTVFDVSHFSLSVSNRGCAAHGIVAGAQRS